MRSYRVAFLGVACFALAAAACGHSEEEWQAQLAKYNTEVQKNQANQKTMAEMQQSLDLTKGRVTELESQLQSMGMDMTKLNEALATKGQALESVNSDLAQMRKALAEYQARARTLEAIKARMLALRKKLESLTALGLKVNIRRNRMIISLPGDILFDSGKTDLKPEGKRVLLEVAKVVRGDAQLLERDFQVAGHTDNQPLNRAPYWDNWGLSLMRAREVLKFLISPIDIKPSGVGGNRVEPGGGLPGTRWSAGGFGDTDPVSPNDNAQNMQRNRRVELIVMPNVEEMLDLKSLTNVQ